MKYHANVRKTTIAASPPTTPPTIGPTGEGDVSSWLADGGIRGTVDVVDGTGDDDEVAVITMDGSADCGIAAAEISQLSVLQRRSLLPE